MNHQPQNRFRYSTLASTALTLTLLASLPNSIAYGQASSFHGENSLRPGKQTLQAVQQDQVPPNFPQFTTKPIQAQIQPGRSGVNASEADRMALEQLQTSTTPIIAARPSIDNITSPNESPADFVPANQVSDSTDRRVPADKRWTELTSDFLGGSPASRDEFGALERQLDNIESGEGTNSSAGSFVTDGQVRTASRNESVGTVLIESDGGVQAKGTEETPLAKAGQLNELVERVVYYTLVVISLGVGFIAISKIWQAKLAPQVEESNTQSDLKVLNTIKLSSKVTLTLVGIGNEKVVVASDHVGVKSVIRLGEENQGTLDEIQSFESVMAGVDNHEPDSLPAAQTQTPSVDPAPPETPSAKVEPAVKSRPDRYTLDMIGQVLKEATLADGAEPRQDRPSKIIRNSSGAEPKTGPSPRAKGVKDQETNQAAIVAAMEAAMTESGLKELVLQSLKSKR